MSPFSRYPNHQSSPLDRESALEAVCHLFTAHLQGRGEAILTSVSADRHPHACWMATLIVPALDTILTFTSPDSRKVCNILENPHAEWMLTGADKREVVYARGDVRVIQEPSRVFELWEELPDTSRAYFLRFRREGMLFLVLQTDVREIEYCIPSENVFMTFPIAEVRRHCQEVADRRRREPS